MDIRQQICDLGRRIYRKGFAAANDGNISYRLAEDQVLCTPTMQGKGSMEPDDLCVVDMNGRQQSGEKKRSSEVLLHLEVYRRRPDVKAVVHCHPPHATAFAIAREPVPQCVLPEVEIFLGEVPIAKYETPGRQAFCDTIAPLVERANVIILANHGTVSFASNLEHAYWWTEILDAYCRILILAKQLGPIRYIPESKCHELLEYKQEWGCTDPRIDGPAAGHNVCGHPTFQEFWAAAGVQQRAFPSHPESNAPSATATGSPDFEALAEAVAEKVIQRLSRQAAETDSKSPKR